MADRVVLGRIRRWGVKAAVLAAALALGAGASLPAEAANFACA